MRIWVAPITVVFGLFFGSVAALADDPSPGPGFMPGLDPPAFSVVGLVHAWTLREPFALPAPRLLSLPLPALRLDSMGAWFDPRTLTPQGFYREGLVEHDFSIAGRPMTLRTSGYDLDGRPAPSQQHGLPMWQTGVVTRLPKDFYVGASVQQRAVTKRVTFVAGKRF
jgi:hypothetical protein